MMRTRQVLASGLLLATLSLGVAPGWAEQVIKHLKNPVRVTLQTPLDGASASEGQTFDATLPDTLQYKEWTLPANTQFHGHITKVRHSKHFNRPGYVVLQVDEARLPNGQSFTIDPQKYEPRDKKLRHPEAYTFAQSVATQLPYTAISLAVTIPLRYAADANTFALVPVGVGVRMLAGATAGLFRPRFKNEPVPRKIALGALDGSGIPRIVRFFGKYPEPDYRAGDTIKLYLNSDALGDMMKQETPNKAAETIDSSQTAAAASAR